MAQNNQPKKFLGENLPLKKRKMILWLIVMILTVIIFIFWLSLLKIIIAPDNQDKKEIEKMQKIQEDLSNFLNQTKESLDQAQEQFGQLRQPTAQNLPPASAELIAALKEKLLNSDLNDWPTYQNSRYGFSFQYPGDWQFNSVTTDQTSQFIASAQPAQADISQTGLWLFGSNNTEIFERCENKKFQNQPACFSQSSAEDITTEEINILNGDKKITLKFSYQTVHQESFQEIFNKLLATFKFSEPDKRL